MNIITDKAELAKLIASIATRGKKLDLDIQQAGVSALSHLSKHGDIGFCNKLYLAMPKGARHNALTSWLLTYGSIEANTDTATKAAAPFKYAKEKATDIEGAKADMWFDHKPSPQPDEVFDLAKAVQQVIKKAQGKQLIHGELLTGLQGLVAMVNAPEGVTTTSVDDDGTTD